MGLCDGSPSKLIQRAWGSQTLGTLWGGKSADPTKAEDSAWHRGLLERHRCSVHYRVTPGRPLSGLKGTLGKMSAGF